MDVKKDDLMIDDAKFCRYDFKKRATGQMGIHQNSYYSRSFLNIKIHAAIMPESSSTL